ncbi:MAG TPA: hypothetical protein VFP59_19345 [Candidatus Angelobacter sp.]|nr:hypothetical protein [Candidatus Angelobacter sp.]
MLVTRNVVTKEEVIAAVKELAGKLGRPPRYAEVMRVVNVTRRQIQRMFGGWAAVLEESGCERIRLGGGELTMHQLWLDWVAVARQAGRMPTIRRYEKFSRYSVRPLKDRFGAWERIPAAMFEYGDSKGLWAGWEDVRELIGRKVEDCTRGQRYTQKPTTEARRHGEESPESRGIAVSAGIGKTPPTTEKRRRGGRQNQEFVAPGLKPLSLDRRYAALHHPSNPTPGLPGTPLKGRSSTQKQQQPGVPAESRSSGEFWSPLPTLDNPQEAPVHGSPLTSIYAQQGRGVITPMPEGVDESMLYGEPLSLAPMATAPTNEAGVMFLFATLARELGFVVLKVQKGFPDCEVLRRLPNGKWQRVRVEFEFASRNFVLHGHDVKGCEMIVCWENNWQECPIEVLELKKVFTADLRG